MGNQGILRGWTAWEGAWRERVRRQRLLATAAARLARPMVVACLGVWKARWRAWEHELRSKGHAQLAAEAMAQYEARLRQLEEEHAARLAAEVQRQKLV